MGTLLLLAGMATGANAQTVLIDPNGDGGFENGATFSANGWTVFNGGTATTNRWALATANLTNGTYNFNKTGNYAAFITNSATANTWAYSGTSATVHFYRNVQFPAGQTNVNLSFRWNCLGEFSNWDALYVYIADTTVTPVLGSPSGSSTTPFWTGTGTPTLVGGPYYQLPAGNGQTTTVNIPQSAIGNATSIANKRLFFVWKNDVSGIYQPPVALDDISLTSICAGLAPPVLSPAASAICAGSSVILTSTLPAPSASTLLLSESFENGTLGAFSVSTGALNTATTGTTNWANYTNSGLGSLTTSNGNNFVAANADAGGYGSVTHSLLTTTGTYNTNGYNSLTLSFRHYYLAYAPSSPAEQVLVQASTNNGTTWTTVQSYTTSQGTASNFAQAVIPMNAYLNVPNLRLRFQYLSNWGFQWAIDSVRLVGVGAGAGSTNKFTSVAGLYKDAALTTPMGANDTNRVVYASPANTTTYTAYTNMFGCQSAISNNAVVTVNQLPPTIITAGGPTIFCTGGSVVLSAPAGFTYVWNRNGSPITPAATSQTYTATTSGTYTVTVTNATPCTATTPTGVAVTVNPLPAAIITPSAATAICAGTTQTLSTNTGTGLVYQWFRGTALLPGATGATYTTDSAGSYTVRVTNSNGCVKVSSATVLTVKPLPIATTTPSGPQSICSGDTLSIAASAGAGYTYQWKNGTANAAGASTSRTYRTPLAGTYSVAVTLNGCTVASAPVAVTVIPRPVALISPTTPTTACDSVVFKSASTGVTYQWKLNGNNILSANDSSYIARTSGAYSVRVTVNGCSVTSTATQATVHPSPSGAITYSSPLTFCEGGAVVLNTLPGANQTYVWYRNNGAISGANNFAYIVDTSGIYKVMVTNTATGCTRTSTTTITVTVNSNPSPVVVYNSATNELTTTRSYATYQWFRNNQLIANATQSIYRPTQNGAYSVMVNDTNGCGNTSTIVFVNSVGIKNTPVAASIKVYPNPTNGILHVDAAAKVKLALHDVTGKVVLRSDNDHEVNIENMADGMYLLYISDAQGHLLKAEKITKSSR
jgi:hypothetical protein